MEVDVQAKPGSVYAVAVTGYGEAFGLEKGGNFALAFFFAATATVCRRAWVPEIAICAEDGGEGNFGYLCCCVHFELI